MEDQKNTQSDRAYHLFALKIVGDFGATIAVPVVIMAMIGHYLDNRWQTGPLFIILGFVLAALLTARIIYRKAKRYGEIYQKLR